MVIVGLEVSLSAGSVAGSTVDRGTVVARVGRGDGETVLGEDVFPAEIDAAHIPVDGVAGLGVLELEHVGLLLSVGQLDGDATTVAVCLPGFLVVATVRRKGMHVTDSIRNRPRVNGFAQVVDNVDTAAPLDRVGSGESSGEAGKSGQSDSLGEHHFECGGLFEKEG